MILPSHLLTILLLLIISRSKVLEQKEGYIKFQLGLNQEYYPFYEVELYLGDPKQPQSFIVDTGSSYFLVKVSACVSCADVSTDPLFRPADSGTFQAFDCKQDLQICDRYCQKKQKKQFDCHKKSAFGDQTSQLQLSYQYVKEIVSLTSNPEETSINTVIGAIQKMDKKAIKSNGILGLSAINQISFLFDWFTANNVPPKNMNLGLCLDELTGTMEWGAVQQKGSDPIIIKMNSVFQTDEITEYSIGNINLFGNRKRIIPMMDSGSPYLLFPFEILTKVEQLFSSLCSSQPQTCYQIEQEENENTQKDPSRLNNKCFIFDASNYFDQIPLFVDAMFPAISIKFSGKEVKIKPSNYFQQIEIKDYIGQVKSACLIMVPSQKQYILGVPFFKEKKLIYNLDQYQLKLYDEYNCLERKVETQQVINNYIGFLGVFVFIFFRNFLVNLVRRFWRKKEQKEEYDESQSKSEIENENEEKGKSEEV